VKNYASDEKQKKNYKEFPFVYFFAGINNVKNG
jgi:hypothetical protein